MKEEPVDPNLTEDQHKEEMEFRKMARQFSPNYKKIPTLWDNVVSIFTTPESLWLIWLVFLVLFSALRACT